jgi:hypothetical protein
MKSVGKGGLACAGMVGGLGLFIGWLPLGNGRLRLGSGKLVWYAAFCCEYCAGMVLGFLFTWPR